MASGLNISATREFGARRPTIQSKIERLKERLNALPDDELENVLESIAQALDQPAASTDSNIASLFAGPTSESERVEDALELLMRSFERRRELLAESLTAPQVARLLNTTRQTPHDRVKAGTLLAVMDRGALRFPSWQFDPEGPNGVVADLPEVLRALEIPPIAKISWLVRSNEMFDRQRPLDLLKDNQIERVIRQAHGVGVA